MKTKLATDTNSTREARANETNQQKTLLAKTNRSRGSLCMSDRNLMKERNHAGSYTTTRQSERGSPSYRRSAASLTSPPRQRPATPDHCAATEEAPPLEYVHVGQRKKGSRPPRPLTP